MLTGRTPRRRRAGRTVRASAMRWYRRWGWPRVRPSASGFANPPASAWPPARPPELLRRRPRRWPATTPTRCSCGRCACWAHATRPRCRLRWTPRGCCSRTSLTSSRRCVAQPTATTTPTLATPVRSGSPHRQRACPHDEVGLLPLAGQLHRLTHSRTEAEPLSCRRAGGEHPRPTAPGNPHATVAR